MGYFTAEVPLRWVDLDAQGHVNNSLFVDYLQEARARWLTDGPAEPLLREGAIVTKHQVQYLAPVHHSSEPLIVEVGVLKLGGARFDLDYKLSHEGTEVARARSIMCPYDFDTEAPRRLSQIERDYLSQFMVEVEPFKPLESPALEGRGVPFDLDARWSDVDRYGHVNNVRFFDYVQQARIVAMMDASPLMARPGTAEWDAIDEADRGRYTWLLARQDMDFLAQMTFRTTPYRVLSAPTRIGDTSMVFTAEIVDQLDDDAVLARSRTILVAADADGKPIKLPQELREPLEAIRV